MQKHFAAISSFILQQMCTVILWKFYCGHSVYLSVSELNNAKITVRNFSTIVLSGWVLHDSLLHSGLEHGNFLNSAISQGSTATRLRCGGILNEGFCCKFTTESVSERTLKISQHWRSYGQDYSGLFFWLAVVTLDVDTSMTFHSIAAYQWMVWTLILITTYV